MMPPVVLYQASLPPDQKEASHIIEYPQAKEEAFDFIEEWIATHYRDPQKVFQLRNKETGTIIVKAVTLYPVPGRMRVAPYTLIVRIKDKKSMLTFVMHPDPGAHPSNAYPAAVSMPNILAEFREIAKDIENSLKKGRVDDF